MQDVRYLDVYHAALIYCLGICDDCRLHIDEIYDFKTGCVNSDCLNRCWLTSSSGRVIRMAFNLYSGGAPSIYKYSKKDEQLSEILMYMPDRLFCTGDAPYFWQAIKIRFPEYIGTEPYSQWESLLELNIDPK